MKCINPYYTTIDYRLFSKMTLFSKIAFYTAVLIYIGLLVLLVFQALDPKPRRNVFQEMDHHTSFSEKKTEASLTLAKESSNDCGLSSILKVPNKNNSELEIDIDIDFNEASNAWRANKKQHSNCHFTYICGAITKTGKRCEKTPKGELHRCHLHKGCKL